MQRLRPSALGEFQKRRRLGLQIGQIGRFDRRALWRLLMQFRDGLHTRHGHAAVVAGRPSSGRIERPCQKR